MTEPHFMALAPQWTEQAAHAQARSSAPLPAAAVWLDEALAGHAPLFEICDGVAVVPVMGLLIQRCPLVGLEWITGYNVLSAQIAAADADPAVRAILLHVDSPGGQVAGCFTLCAELRARRASGAKPLIAVVDEVAASAGYALAVCADEIAAPATAAIGSVGVIAVHFDLSGLMGQMGVAPDILAAGARKADGHPFGALPEPVRATELSRLADFRETFASHVAECRAPSGLGFDAVMASEACMFVGPREIAEAQAAGWIDLVASPAEAVALARRNLDVTPAG